MNTLGLFSDRLQEAECSLQSAVVIATDYNAKCTHLLQQDGCLLVAKSNCSWCCCLYYLLNEAIYLTLA